MHGLAGDQQRIGGVRPGSGCFTDLNCTNGNFCPNPDAQIGMHRCEARKMEGASCGLANECLSLTCTAGKCAPATKQSAYCLK